MMEWPSGGGRGKEWRRCLEWTRAKSPTTGAPGSISPLAFIETEQYCGF